MNAWIFRLAAVAAIAVILLGFGAFVLGLIRDDAAREVVDTITRQNEEAGNAADIARNRYDAGCPDGMRFDFATGKCAGAAVGRGN